MFYLSHILLIKLADIISEIFLVKFHCNFRIKNWECIQNLNEKNRHIELNSYFSRDIGSICTQMYIQLQL